VVNWITYCRHSKSSRELRPGAFSGRRQQIHYERSNLSISYFPQKNRSHLQCSPCPIGTFTMNAGFIHCRPGSRYAFKIHREITGFLFPTYSILFPHKPHNIVKSHHLCIKNSLYDAPFFGI